MAEKPIVIAVTGPTATGKTALGIELAKKFSGEIVSCDSMQVYKGLKIGTAQPEEGELSQVRHHLIGFLGWEENFSVSDYVKLAGETIGEIDSRGRLPVLVGGTGLYARSLLRGFTFTEECRDDNLRAKLFSEAQKLGPDEMHRKLAELDSVSAEEIHPNNLKRVLRALEYCILSGEPFSRQTERSRQAEGPYRYVMICPVFRDRRRLYERINARVDRMLEKGLLEEAQKLYSFCKSAPKPPTAAQSIGYKELFPYFEGQIALEEAVENIKRESRRYAKRQLTWFAREPEIRYLYMDGLCGTDAALEECMKILESCEFYTELSLREGGGAH
ncbi:tRNA (adenosine(37)-N6)-dimethylallyltransferase MiaA [Acutalibacter muris]|jgi:tRNA dimethylallyltransferase|uniref:tRNA (adenosine(37)-N6)-dimethylallyltransferase MiaA n=1 Tax=Acutalibacter muris TaxID=1796620 RepID=UPI0026F3B7FB|nr:tRNA (adenosine(37)-N6)-dimethylallyltransferase MiaA [Acutalibacter muris]